MNTRDKTFLYGGIVLFIFISILVPKIINSTKQNVDNTLTNATISARARTVEGHIRNIELAIISEAFSSQDVVDMSKYDKETNGATIEAALTLPINDNVNCSSYEISKGTVESAKNCTSSNWEYTFNYARSSGAEKNK